MKLFFFDIDGTIFIPEKNIITNETKDAIHKLQNNGDLCFICSGRPNAFISKEVIDVKFDGYILGNGSLIKYQDRILETHYFDKYKAKQLIRLLETYKLEYILLTDTKAYLKKEYEYLHKFYRKCNVNFELFESNYELEEILEHLLKIEVYYKDEKTLQVLDMFKDNFLIIHQELNKICEITTKSLSKGSAIETVSQYFNTDETYCFGDGLNDIEMFKICKYAIAVDNAHEEIKKLATTVTKSVYDNGVAYYINNEVLK